MTSSFSNLCILFTENDSGAIKISTKLSNGKAFARRYHKSDLVRSLFAVTLTVDESFNTTEGAAREFDLVMRYPALSLLTCLDNTLQDCNLANSQVFLKFL